MYYKEQAKTKLLVLCISIIGIISFIVAVGNKNDKKYTTESVVVTYGDTLWDIAVENCPESMDKRDYIDFIQLDNKCDVNIQPGDVLNIRVYEE